jgi:predicted nucleic-acid-binding protein
MTRAVDTNVLVQFLTHGDDLQWPKAQRLLASGIEIPDTVLLETEWILRAVHRIERRDIGRAFEALRRLDPVTFRDRQRIDEALRLYRLGLDFADAMHAALATSTTLRTFDKTFVKVAKRANSSVSVEGI